MYMHVKQLAVLHAVHTFIVCWFAMGDVEPALEPAVLKWLGSGSCLLVSLLARQQARHGWFFNPYLCWHGLIQIKEECLKCHI